MEKKYEITVSSPDDKGKQHVIKHEVVGEGISPISCYTNAVRQINEMIGDKKGHEITEINGPKVYYGRQKG